jgi:hypothetical protein
MHAMLARGRGKAQIAPNRRKASMTSDSPARDFRLPHRTALIDDAVAAGYAREVAVAVLIDLITSPRFDTAVPDRTADADPLPGWECRPDDPVLIVGRSPQAPPIGAQDEADFVRPFNWLRD